MLCYKTFCSRAKQGRRAGRKRNRVARLARYLLDGESLTTACDCMAGPATPEIAKKASWIVIGGVI